MTDNTSATRLALVAREAAAAGVSPRPSALSEAETELAERVRALRIGTLGQGLQTTASAELSVRFSETRLATELLARELKVTAPPFEEFFALGAEAPSLEQAAAGELVPILAPHGLGAAVWQRVAAANGVLPPIECATEVLRWFAALDRPALESAAPTVRNASVHGSVTWTLRWISASAAPSSGTSVTSPTPELTAGQAWPSLPEMLALQARQRSLAAPLVDGRTFTWLAGVLPDRTLAARHTFDGTTGSIRISTRVRSDHGSHVGTRRAC
ncbi:hypothetical protein [Leucobacter aridicollis]|uniref:hypothetical protein n=1 Tax=Leucobacter aridicollis TaxID=283878 RepID=UPI00210549E7|nr:hypothetical protein [Leucobacter aridicollis]UTX52435.1 hypothetical protein KI794_11855 [Leucobacter aridicollis]